VEHPRKQKQSCCYCYKYYHHCCHHHHNSNQNCQSLLFLLSLIGILGGGIQLGPLGPAATNMLIVPAPGYYDDGVGGGMIGKGN
jgi:hypothetical protein